VTVHDPYLAQAMSGTSSESHNGIEVATLSFIFDAHRDALGFPRRGDFKAAFSEPVLGHLGFDVIQKFADVVEIYDV
jgi:hypothetical protein